MIGRKIKVVYINNMLFNNKCGLTLFSTKPFILKENYRKNYETIIFFYLQAVNVSRQVGATTYVETSAKWSSKAVCDAFEIAALAALGRLNKNTCLAGDRLRPAPRSKSKVDLKSELKDRARSCVVM